VLNDGTYLGHAVFSGLPMGDNGQNVVWLNVLAVKHGDNDDHEKKVYVYQRKGVGTALVRRGLESAKSLGYAGCLTSGAPAVYRDKMGFSDIRDFGIEMDETVCEPYGAIFAYEIVPGCFDITDRTLSFKYYEYLEDDKPDQTELRNALKALFGADVSDIKYKVRQLNGGTLGDVRLLAGDAETGGERRPFKLVHKTQKKWERYNDPGSWRREYDLYTSGFGALFTESFRWPRCYHAKMGKDEFGLWMEYISGVTGLDLTPDMYERAALELGRFAGKLYAEKPAVLQDLDNMSRPDAMKQFYLYYKSWSEVFDYVRSETAEIPGHLCEMIVEADERAYADYEQIETLPVVLCQRDFWVNNIFYDNGDIVLIDWDTAGWGYLGEDLVSLLADEADVMNIHENYRRCVPAYYGGFSEYADISHVNDMFIYERIIIHYGYRLVEWFLNADSPGKKALQIETLQKIYAMKDIKIDLKKDL